MKLSKKVLEAKWSEETSKWTVQLEDQNTFRRFSDCADALIIALGNLNQWKWPEIDGLQSFKGALLHTAAWDTKFDYKNKKVAVIGAGSSGIQVVPAIQPHVSHLDHYIRSRTWVATTFAQESLRKRADSAENLMFSSQEIAVWKEDPEHYLAFRKSLEAELQSGHIITQRGSDAQIAARETFTQLMRDRLKSKPAIADHILPRFPPLCKRLTPGPGYLEALTQPNVAAIPVGISNIDERGIVTTDWIHRPVDAIICATGFDTSYKNRFPIYGEKGMSLQERWKDYPESYLGITIDSFPNLFTALGPNSTQGTGNLLVVLERIASYTALCLAKLQSQNIQSMQPSHLAVKNFTSFCHEYFKGTVYTEECASWYKSGPEGKVTALWPGSSLHAIEALKQVRWEDFEFTYCDGNAFGWFGDGWSKRDGGSEEEKTFYLDGQKMIYEPLDPQEQKWMRNPEAVSRTSEGGELTENKPESNKKS